MVYDHLTILHGCSVTLWPYYVQTRMTQNICIWCFVQMFVWHRCKTHMFSSWRDLNTCLCSICFILHFICVCIRSLVRWCLKGIKAHWSYSCGLLPWTQLFVIHVMGSVCVTWAKIKLNAMCCKFEWQYGEFLWPIHIPIAFVRILLQFNMNMDHLQNKRCHKSTICDAYIHTVHLLKH